MSLEEIKEAMKIHDIDQLLAYAKRIEPEELDEAVNLYEKYYEAELNVAQTIQNILAQVKSKRIKLKIPCEGSYTYKLEK